MNLPALSLPPEPDSPPAAAPLRSRRWARAWPWAVLVALLVIAQSLLVGLTLRYEALRTQEQVDGLVAIAAADIKQALFRDLQSLQALSWERALLREQTPQVTELMRTRSELIRIERRDDAMRVTDVIDSPFQPRLFALIQRDALSIEAQVACTNAQRLGSPSYSRSYFVPLPDGLGMEVMDVCMPVGPSGERSMGFNVATIALPLLLEDAVRVAVVRNNELSFVDGDGTRLARAGLARGAGIFHADRVVDLPGYTLQLRLDSPHGSPRLIPNLPTALVIGLSIALGAVVLLLVRDVRRRSGVEAALAEALAFRKAMEDSLVTGLRARDTAGRITYVNPAFCAMVGFEASDLIGALTPPYWPPEQVDFYTRRQAVRLAPGSVPAREGLETIFMRKNGERFSVMVFEAPLVDGHGRHTGWMSAVLDVSAQRRMEELSRQQQERLQATARLATVGEMASLLSHELNQPLAAIASYAAGSLNLMRDQPTAHADPDTAPMLRQAMQRIAEQAERAGRVIKSVHDFVRRRDQALEGMRVDHLLDSVLPLVRLQARKSGTRVEIDVRGATPSSMPRVLCDRTMLEQVLLNLARNGIQAMENNTPLAARELTVRVRQHDARWVTFSVIDHGPGVAAEVADRLFTPFFTTRREGMGLGLSLCRTVIEQHGGTLDFENAPPKPDGSPDGVTFRFTLAADPPRRSPAQPSDRPATQPSADPSPDPADPHEPPMISVPGTLH
ncbi:MAG: sensor histidine kinase [Rhizobacter sp.]|nr:sensor histidine kinase [Rhizobacter sp.]